MNIHDATETAYKNGYKQGMKDVLAKDNNVPSKWISVKDRLPTEEDALVNGSVYAFTKAKKVQILRYQYVCQFAKYMHCWMPISLPQPPKGE